MKRFLTITLLLLSLTACFGQSKKYVYCEVLPEVKAIFRGDRMLRVNYGQAKSLHSSSEKTRICNERGEPLSFANRIAALNWLSEIGWEFCSSTTDVTGGGDSSVTAHETWILRYCVEGLSEDQIQAIYEKFNVRKPQSILSGITGRSDIGVK